MPPDLQAIQTAADAAQMADDLRKSDDSGNRLSQIEERLALIEPLMEELHANIKLGTALSEYVKDLRSEQVFFNTARIVVGIVAGLAILFIAALLSLSIFHPDSPLLKSPPVAIAAIILGLVSGLVLIITGFVKGVFRSTVDRHADGFLPPALEKGVELMSKVINPKSH
jgi:hypothetical protein